MVEPADEFGVIRLRGGLPVKAVEPAVEVANVIAQPFLTGTDPFRRDWQPRAGAEPAIGGRLRWCRDRHELLLIGTRGDIPCPLPGTQPASLIAAPRPGTHSEKPA